MIQVRTNYFYQNIYMNIFCFDKMHENFNNPNYILLIWNNFCNKDFLKHATLTNFSEHFKSSIATQKDSSMSKYQENGQFV